MDAHRHPPISTSEQDVTSSAHPIRPPAPVHLSPPPPGPHAARRPVYIQPLRALRPPPHPALCSQHTSWLAATHLRAHSLPHPSSSNYAAMSSFFGSRSKHLPPGPPGLPILGNLTQIPSTEQWVWFHDISKKYGGYLVPPSSPFLFPFCPRGGVPVCGTGAVPDSGSGVGAATPCLAGAGARRASSRSAFAHVRGWRVHEISVRDLRAIAALCGRMGARPAPATSFFFRLCFCSHARVVFSTRAHVGMLLSTRMLMCLLCLRRRREHAACSEHDAHRAQLARGDRCALQQEGRAVLEQAAAEDGEPVRSPARTPERASKC